MQESKFEKIASSLDELFLNYINLGGLDWIGFRGLLLGLYQSLSIIGKLSVLDSLLNLEEDVFKRDSELIQAWDDVCAHSKDKPEERVIKYLIEAIGNYSHAFKIARSRGWDLAELCAEHHIYLRDIEVKELGEQDFHANWYDARNSDGVYDFSSQFSFVHKQAWVDGYYSGFVLNPKGKDHELVIGVANSGRKQKLKGYKELLAIIEEESKQAYSDDEEYSKEHKKSVKLIKVCKELNIAMSTLIQWCEQNGISVDSDPHYLLSDELYEKLKQHFAHKPDAGVQLDGIYGCDAINSDSDCYPQDEYDTLNDAFEGEVDLYNDWLMN